MELGHWVTGSMGHLGHLSRPGHRCKTRVFPVFEKCPKCKKYSWNAEMTKVIVRCLLLDWNHWVSVHAMNFYFYLWLLKILWPENTSSHISRYLEFTSWIPARPSAIQLVKCDPVPSLLDISATWTIRARRRCGLAAHYFDHLLPFPHCYCGRCYHRPIRVPV